MLGPFQYLRAQKTSDLPHSLILPWIASILLVIYIARSEFRQWVTLSMSSSLEILQHAAVLGAPMPPSHLEKIKKNWLWSWLVWKDKTFTPQQYLVSDSLMYHLIRKNLENC